MTGPVSASRTINGRLRPLVASFSVLSRPALLAALGVIAMIVPATFAQGQSLLYEGSVRYSEGKYNLDETVRSAFLLNELTWSSHRWYAEVTVPVIYQDSANVRYAGGMPMPGGTRPGVGNTSHHPGHPGDPDPPSEAYSDVAVGDPYLRVEADVYRSLFGTSSLGAFGTVKLPVASESRGFGTGEWDLGAGVTWTRRVASSRFRAEVAYWALGEPPDVTLENPIAAELSYGRFLSDGRYLLEATIRGRTVTTKGIEGPAAIDLTLHRSSGNSGNVYVGLEAGLTESAPDYALTVGYAVRVWGADD